MSNKPRRGDVWVPPPARTSKRSKCIGKTSKNEDVQHITFTSKPENSGPSTVKSYVMVDAGCQTLSHHSSEENNFLAKLEKFHKDLKLIKSYGQSLNVSSDLIHRPRNVAPIDARMMTSLVFQSDQHIMSFLQALEDFQFNVLAYEESFGDDMENCFKYEALSEESKDWALMRLLKTYDVLTSAMKFIFDIQLESDLSHLEEDRDIHKQHSESLRKEMIARDSLTQETEKKLSLAKEEIASLIRHKVASEDKNTQLVRELSHTNLLLEQMKLQAESHDHLLKNAEENDKLLQIIEDLHSRNEAEKNALKKAIKVQKQRGDEYKNLFEELNIKLAEKDQKCYNLSAERDEWKGQMTASNNDLIEAQRRIAEMQSRRNLSRKSQDQMTQVNISYKKVDDGEGDVSEKSPSFEESKAETELACGMLKEENKNLISLLQEVKNLFQGNSSILSQRNSSGWKKDNQSKDEALYSLVQEIRDQLNETYKICQQCSENLSRNDQIEILEKEHLSLKEQLQNEIKERLKLQKRCDELQYISPNSRRNIPSCDSSKEQHLNMRDDDVLNESATSVQSNRQLHDQEMNKRLKSLDVELKDKTSKMSALQNAKCEMEEKYARQVKELQEKLDDATLTSESMKKYVELLKSSYINVFGVS